MVASQADGQPRISALQTDRLAALLAEILPRNRFYARKFVGRDTADFFRLPFTTKEEVVAAQAADPPYGDLTTYPVDRYVRIHQTSGTSGRPLRWPDTRASFDWMLGLWQQLFGLAGLRPGDRLFFPFSFGPFLGFWTAFEAAARLGYFCLPAGGMSSLARLRLLLEFETTVVLCTPTYALRLAEVAGQHGLPLAQSPVRALILAGEPGGCIPATRARIEQAWGARVFDHAGMTEIGPLAMECAPNPAGMHVLEDDYVVEVIDPVTGHWVPEGQTGELVLTNLGRWGSPLLRYRTGDLVRLDARPCPCGCKFARLDGGLLGRQDDMIHLRGNNIYPAALEAVLHRFRDLVEFRIGIDRSSTLPVLRIEVEPAPQAAPDLAERVDQAIRDAFHFRAEVRTVSPGSLPRFEMKARRFLPPDRPTP